MDRREYYQRLEQKHAAPLWEVLGDLIPAQPRPTASPALWRYQEMRSLLLEAGRLITPQEAERRVLILENPSMRGTSLITQSMYSGLQLVDAGETTSTHRHATSAIRFVIESEKGYTAVDGVRTTMHPGDLVLTPSWTYHDHGNPGDSPVTWLDGLDVPLVNMLGASFAESYPGEFQPVARPEGDAEAPFNFTYARSREALDRLYRDGPVHECHGIKMQYATPATGGYPMPTIGAFLQLLPAGFRGGRIARPMRRCIASPKARASAILAARISSGEKTTCSWCRRGVRCRIRREGESVLFSFSDRPVQKVLGLWREEIIHN